MTPLAVTLPVSRADPCSIHITEFTPSGQTPDHWLLSKSVDMPLRKLEQAQEQKKHFDEYKQSLLSHPREHQMQASKAEEKARRQNNQTTDEATTKQRRELDLRKLEMQRLQEKIMKSKAENQRSIKLRSDLGWYSREPRDGVREQLQE